MVNIDEWLSRAMECKSLSAAEVKDLCLICREFLLEESNVQPVRSPVTVCGDIHGQFYDLVELLRVGGDVSVTNYIFMGDFVDRGYYSLETLTLLLVLKVKFPSKMTLLRGNHESRQITHIYGFYDECRNKYGSPDAWKDFTMLFDYLTLAAIIDGEVLCIHGGLSPDIQTLDQVRTIPRMQEVPNSGPFSDLLWSDPDDRITGWRTSTRGAGFVFGSMVAQQFTEINGLNLICRAHQLVQQGFQYHFPAQSVVTVWSAPNYCYRCGNVAAVLAFDEHLGREFHTFSAVPNDRRQVPSPKEVAYFL